MPARALHKGVMVVVVLITSGVCGYWFAKGAAHVAREAFREFVSG